MVSIFAFSLYALEKQGTPLVKKEKPLSEKEGEKGVSGCCKEENAPLPLATVPAKKPAKLQVVRGEKKAPSEGEDAPAPKASNKKPQPAKAPSSDVKVEKESEKKDVSSDEEEGEEEEEFEEYNDDESGLEDDEDTDFSGY